MNTPSPDAALQGRTLRGLYAITPDTTDATRLTALVARALEGGIDVLQFRVKGGTPTERDSLARAVKTLTDRANVPLIVNDDVALACAIDAAGVHIGRDDGDPMRARDRVGPNRWLGVSCYDDLDRARSMIGIADHVGFGSVFASPTKPHAVRAPLTLFRDAQHLGLRTVAIGGIDRSNAALPIDAGADAVAVISDLFAADDVARAAAELRDIVHRALARRSV
jgi:thiamine-phosphate pyrophosphorylase